MAELEIDKEDVHDRKKWRRNVMKRKSNPIGKWSLVGVEPITSVIRSGTLIWYGPMGPVMRKSDEDCVKKCMEFSEGRRPIRVC